jgi:hypothetical protein
MKDAMVIHMCVFRVIIMNCSLPALHTPAVDRALPEYFPRGGASFA